MSKTEGLDVLLRYIVNDVASLLNKKTASKQKNRPPSIFTSIRRGVSAYVSASTPKEKFKDLVFVSSLLGFILFALWIVDNKDILAPPYVKYPNGVEVRGNCSWIWEDYRIYSNRTYGSLKPNELQAGANYSLPSGLIRLDGGEPIVCPTPECPVCPVVECPAPVCPIPVCPAAECPIPEPTVCPTQSVLDNASRKALLNIRLPTSSPCEQSGCIKCMRKTWETLELADRPRFNPAPSPVGSGFYDILDPRKEADQRICFTDESGRGDKFRMNMSTWRVVGYGNGTGYFILEKRL